MGVWTNNRLMPNICHQHNKYCRWKFRDKTKQNMVIERLYTVYEVIPTAHDYTDLCTVFDLALV